jgi:hypothetical protein
MLINAVQGLVIFLDMFLLPRRRYAQCGNAVVIPLFNSG